MRIDELATTLRTATGRAGSAVGEGARRSARVLGAKTRVEMLLPVAAAVALGSWLEVPPLYVVLFVGVSSLWGVVLYNRVRGAWRSAQPGSAPPTSSDTQARRMQTRWGITEGVLVAVVLIVAVFDRFLMPVELYWVLGSVIVVVAVAVRLWNSHDPTQQLHAVTIRLVVEPFVVAWVVVSVLHGATLIVFRQGGTVSESRENDQARQDERARRRAVAARAATAAPVAVTLSGGGYRAAATEAGALWLLDQVELPVDLLSTVSGGSILGANYAACVSPERFVQALCRGKPGLSMLLVNIAAVLAEVFLPGVNSGDTYAWHFSATYFHGAKLKDTGPPTLILNSTRYDTGTRVAFWPPNSNELTLARGVAASGAFPAAFDPVRIENVTADGKPDFFIDGGTDENLGVDGLWGYLKEGTSAPIPNVLIIVDVSKDPALVPATGKPSQLSAILGAQDIVYRSLHRRIFDHYSNGGYSPLADASTARTPMPVIWWRLHKEDIWPFIGDRRNGRLPDLGVVIVRPTAPEERAWYSTDTNLAKRLENVAKLRTLAELEPSQITDAVWFGAKAMARRWSLLREITGLPLKDAPDLATTPKCEKTKRPVDTVDPRGPKAQ